MIAKLRSQAARRNRRHRGWRRRRRAGAILLWSRKAFTRRLPQTVVALPMELWFELHQPMANVMWTEVGE